MRSRGCAVAAAALLLASCSREEPPAPAPAPTLPRMELGGCAAIGRGPVCEISDDARTVRLWFESTGLTVSAQLGSNDVPVAAVGALDGTRISAEIPADLLALLDAEDVPLQLTVTGATGSARHTIPLRRYVDAPALVRARALRREGKLVEAAAVLREEPAPSAAVAARAKSLAARLALASGEGDAARRAFAEAIAEHHAAGRASDEALDGFALAYSLRERRDFRGARAALDGAAAALSDWDEGRAHAAYYAALLDRDRGDPSGALAALADAEERATRLGMGPLLHDVRDVRARLLQALGRSEEARRTFRVMDAERPSGLSPCRLGELANNLAWTELLRAEGGEPFEPAALSSLDEAADVYRTRCPRADHLQSVLVNRALASLFAGRPEEAERRAREARAAAPEPTLDVMLWLLDVEARAALAGNRLDEAAARYEEMRARADLASVDEAVWRATVGLGDVRLARADGAGAVVKYRDAERLLDAEARGVPLAEGRAAFLSGRARGAEKLALGWLSQGDAPQALRGVRAARSRALAAAARQGRIDALSGSRRALWDDAVGRYRRERDALERLAAADWKLPKDRLAAAKRERASLTDQAARALADALTLLDEGPAAEPPPIAPGDGLLAAIPAGAGQLVVFFAESTGVATARVSAPNPLDFADILLSPFAAELGRVRRLRVLSEGLTVGLDLHALSFRGRPLLATVPVVYAVDLPPSPPRSSSPSGRLVVSDPREDLPEARREVARLRALSDGWRTLEGPEATRAAVQDELARAELFHFAGHGVFGEGAGGASKLLLADGGELRAADVLLALAVPRWVILSGCETARVESHRTLGLGLATAFVAAGAEVVVATSRPVRDTLAADLAVALHERLAAGDPLELALRNAQLGIAAKDPTSDWAAYRAVVR